MGRRPLVTAIEKPQGHAGHRPGPNGRNHGRHGGGDEAPRAGAPAKGGYVLAVQGIVIGGGILNAFIGALIPLSLIGLITRA